MEGRAIHVHFGLLPGLARIENLELNELALALVNGVGECRDEARALSNRQALPDTEGRVSSVHG